MRPPVFKWRRLTIALSGGLLIAAFALQISGQEATSHGGLPPSECRIEVRNGYRYITANGIPNHSTGDFPNQGNPNSISAQSYQFKVPVVPTGEGSDTRGYTFGVAVNGVPFDPGTAELWNGDRRWHYEALTGVMAEHGSLGMDHNLAHVQPTGAYHYHGLPMGLLQKLNYRSKMTLVGYGADGYPIYGPYCYSDPDNARSALKAMRSSYRLKSGSRPSGDGPSGRYDGSFAQDYEWVKGAGDLDQFNGRIGVTPEYPQGTFYYVLTENWPFVPRWFRGQPDDSFRKGPPGGGPPGAGGRVQLQGRGPGTAGGAPYGGGTEYQRQGGPGNGAGGYVPGGRNGIPPFNQPPDGRPPEGPQGGPPGAGPNGSPPGGQPPGGGPYRGSGGQPPAGGPNGGPPGGQPPPN